MDLEVTTERQFYKPRLILRWNVQPWTKPSPPPCSDLLGSSDCNSRCRNNNVLANQLFPPSDLSVYLNNAIRNVNISAIYI